MVSEAALCELDEWEAEERQVAAEEVLNNDPVARNITYRSFCSRSKGWRNGKQRVRKHWKDVQLVRYRGGYSQWHRFPFDEYATEIIGQHADGELLKERIIEHWGY